MVTLVEEYFKMSEQNFVRASSETALKAFIVHKKSGALVAKLSRT
jgi:hypothetical protein